MTTRRHLLAGLAPLTALAALPARAQPASSPAWPERPVRVMVPFPPGSTPDIAARAVATHFTQVFGQPFVAENRSGAGGTIGTEAVAKATDGHTIGVTINAPLTTAPVLYPNLGYDPRRDLAPVSLLLRMAQVLVVHPSVPAQELAGFLAHVRANPEQLSYGTVGSGSAGHLAVEDLSARAGGLRMLHVPYRGFPPAVLDLVAGRLQAMILTVAAVLPQIRAGQLRALGVSAGARIPQLPDIPTFAEAGMPDSESYAWIGLIAPAATPAERVARLAAEAKRGLDEPQARAALENAGFEVVASSPAEFAGFVAAETARWGGLVTRLGIRLEG